MTTKSTLHIKRWKLIKFSNQLNQKPKQTVKGKVRDLKRQPKIKHFLSKVNPNNEPDDFGTRTTEVDTDDHKTLDS